MKKRKIFIALLFAFMLLINVSEVYASSGKLRKASIKTCNGVTYGQHSSDNHWHVAEEKDGSYYATGNPIYSDPCVSSNNNANNNDNNNDSNNENKNDENKDDNKKEETNNQPENTTGNTNENNSSNNNNNNNSNSTEDDRFTTVVDTWKEPKSSDNSLKSIIIEGKAIEVSENIIYSTQKTKIEIIAETNDSKAKYEVENNDNLKIGDNDVVIKVTAEDGSVKNYNIKVNRKLILSSDTNITITIDGEEVVFTDKKGTFNVSSSTKTIEIDCKTKDENAKFEMEKLESLKTGDNIIKIKVTAEDGTEVEYELNIYKYTKGEETISTIISLGIFGGIGYGIYYFVKKKKK